MFDEKHRLYGRGRDTEERDSDRGYSWKWSKTIEYIYFREGKARALRELAP